jgi:hypothetical protein
LCDDAVALRAEARQRRRFSNVRALARQAGRIADELRMLDGAIEQWDGTAPPEIHLTERLETTEAQLSLVEAKPRVLRPRAAE